MNKIMKITTSNDESCSYKIKTNDELISTQNSKGLAIMLYGLVSQFYEKITDRQTKIEREFPLFRFS